MSSFSVIDIPVDVLNQLNLPEFRYEVPAAYSQTLKIDMANPPLDAMLYSLQVRAAEGAADWGAMAIPMARLTELLRQRYSSSSADLEGDSWWITLGSADILNDVITIERDQRLFIAFNKRPDGRLETSVYRPLCARGIGSLLSLNMRQHPDGGVAMRENNWEYAADNAALSSNTYAAMDGRTYMARWANGFGMGQDGDIAEATIERKNVTVRSIELVTTEIRVYLEVTSLLEKLPPVPDNSEQPIPVEYLKHQPKAVEQSAGEAEKAEPTPLTSFYLGTEEGRQGFFYTLYDQYQDDGLLTAVNHIWNSLEKPRGLRCSLMAQRVGRAGTGRRALMRFVKRFLDESLYELNVPDLPDRSGYQTFDDWNAACLAMFRQVDVDLAAIVYRYATILDGQEPNTPDLPPGIGIVIKGPWTRDREKQPKD